VWDCKLGGDGVEVCGKGGGNRGGREDVQIEGIVDVRDYVESCCYS
jgi:hypothetical protein